MARRHGSMRWLLALACAVGALAAPARRRPLQFVSSDAAGTSAASTTPSPVSGGLGTSSSAAYVPPVSAASSF